MAKSLDNLTSKNTKQIEKQMRRYYQIAASQVIESFESTYNKLLASTAEGKEPTPADAKHFKN